MSRRIGAVSALLWLAIVGWYWAREVPLRPQAVVQFKDGEFFEGLSPGGELMISKTSGLNTEYGLIRNGPLECRDPFDAGKKRILFEPGDTISPGSHAPDGRTIVIRDGVAWLANVTTGRVVERLPDIPTTPVASYWFKDDRVVWTSGGDLIVYDLSTKRILCSLKGGPQLEWVVLSTTDRSVAVWANHHGASPSANRDNRIVDVVTGEVDIRFAALSSDGTIELSPDDKYVVVYRADSISVFERESAKELWSVDTPATYGIRFEEEGRVLAVDDVDAQGQLQIARWRLADGTVLSPSASGRKGRAWREVITGSPYAIDSVVTLKPIWEQVLGQARNELDLWFSGTRGTRPDERHRNTLVDTGTGSAIGLLPAEWISGFALPNGRGLMVWSENPPARETVRIYSLPPRKDWDWLIRWAVIPAGLILGFSRLMGRRKSADQLHEVPK